MRRSALIGGSMRWGDKRRIRFGVIMALVPLVVVGLGPIVYHGILYLIATWSGQ